MIPLSELTGRPVVDLDSVTTTGIIDAAILDPDNRRVAGFVLAHGSRLMPGHATSMLPASAIHAIGPDAVTAHVAPMTPEEVKRLQRCPRVFDIVGRHVVTRSGTSLGMIDDIVIDERDGRIVGYSIGGTNVPRRVEQRLAAHGAYPSTRLVRTDLVVMRVLEEAVLRFVRPLFIKDSQRPYVKADADIRVGPDLIIVPDDGVSRDWSGGNAAPASANATNAAPVSVDVIATPPPQTGAAARWGDATFDRDGDSQWLRTPKRVA